MTTFDNGVEVFYPTELSTATTCDTLHGYKYAGFAGSRWKAIGARSYKAAFGAKYHEALAVWDTLRAKGASKDEAQNAALDKALSETWDEATQSPWESGSSKMNRRNLVRAVLWYTDDQPADPKDGFLANIDPRTGEPMIEVTLYGSESGILVPSQWGLAPYKIGVKFDAIGKLGGIPIVLERKSTENALGSFMIQHYTPDLQVDLEDAVVRQPHNVALLGRRHELVIEGHQIAVGFSRWYRWNVDRADSQREEAMRDAHEVVRTVMLNREADDKGEQRALRRSSCGLYGGCDFRAVCSRQPELRAQFLKDHPELYVPKEIRK